MPLRRRWCDAAGAVLRIPRGPGLRSEGQPGKLRMLWGRRRDLTRGFLFIRVYIQNPQANCQAEQEVRLRLPCPALVLSRLFADAAVATAAATHAAAAAFCFLYQPLPGVTHRQRCDPRPAAAAGPAPPVPLLHIETLLCILSSPPSLLASGPLPLPFLRSCLLCLR